MSDMSGVSVGLFELEPIPAIPSRSPRSMRAIPTDPLPIPLMGEPIPIPLSIEGDRGSPSPTGVTRKARTRLHPCTGITLAGLDNEPCGLPVMVDAYALTAEGEVAALREGRHTYQLVHGNLDPRDRWNIPGHPPSHALPVLAEHRCGAPIPEHWKQPPAPPTPTRTPEEF